MSGVIERWLVIPDVHAPYHNVRDFEKLILGKVVPAFQWKGVIILGDFFDCYSVSTFTKDPTRLKGLVKEVERGFALLERFSPTVFPTRIFVEGNHERRIPRMIAEKAPEFYEIVVGWWKERFRGWTYIPYQQDTRVAKLHITHDVGRSGENSTKLSQRDYQDNVIIGHNHTMDFVVRGNAKGDIHVGASFGWLGDIDQVDYRHRMKCRRDWAPGFGIVYTSTRTNFVYVNPKPIVLHTCEVEGRIVSL